MNEKILLPELSEFLAKEAKCSKRTAELFLKEFFSLAEEIVTSGETLKINGLGTFKPIWVAPRESVNIQTGEPFRIPGHYKLSFSPDKKLRDAVNAPFACFDTVVLDAEGHEIQEIQSEDDLAEEENGEEQICTADGMSEPEIQPFVFSKVERPTSETRSCGTRKKDSPLPFAVIEVPSGLSSVEIPERTNFSSGTEEKEMVAVGNEEEKNTVLTVNPKESGSVVEAEPVESVQDDISLPDRTGFEADFSLKPEPDPRFFTESTLSEPELCDGHKTEEFPENRDVTIGEESGNFRETADPELASGAEEVNKEEPLICSPSYTSDTTEPLPVNAENVSEPIKPASAISEDKESLDSPETTEEKVRRKGVKYTLIGGFLLLFFIALYIFRSYRPTGNAGVSSVTEVRQEETNTLRPLKNTDTETVEISQPEKEYRPEESGITEKAPEPVPAKSVTPVTEEIKAGVFMTRMALKHYGNKVFWVYIYEENKDRIKNPNKIPIGTRLVIPDRSKYGIDADNPASVEKATQKAELLKRQFD